MTGIVTQRLPWPKRARKSSQTLPTSPPHKWGGEQGQGLARAGPLPYPLSADVPRCGKSYRFVRPLVLDEETKITFQYKAK